MWIRGHQNACRRCSATSAEPSGVVETAPASGVAPMLARVRSPRTSVAVCICTCRRPDELRALLERLDEAAALVHDDASTTVVVVDDDPGRSADAVLDDFAERFEGGLLRDATGSGNISLARNAATALGVGAAEWVAMIDDDCMPDPRWLAELLAVQRRTGADGVSGRCEDRAPAGSPSWLVDEPFLDGPTAPSDGAPIEIGALKNTMVSSAFLTSTGVTFDEDWGRAGGEDVLFFNACRAAGLDLVFARDAVVTEWVPVDRTRLAYQLRRRLWYGNTESLTSVATGRSTRRRMFARGVKSVLTATAGLVVGLGRGRPQWRWSVAEMLQGTGRMIGAVGVRLAHH